MGCPWGYFSGYSEGCSADFVVVSGAWGLGFGPAFWYRLVFLMMSGRCGSGNPCSRIALVGTVQATVPRFY